MNIGRGGIGGVPPIVTVIRTPTMSLDMYPTEYQPKKKQYTWYIGHKIAASATVYCP